MTQQLSTDTVQDIVRSVATSTIGAGNFTAVRSADTTDLDGNSALEITVVLTSESVAATMPVLDTLVQVRDELLRKGDNRFPFMRYTTPEDEAASLEDDES